MDRDKMSNLYRGPSIDASYQVSVHMAEEFQRRRLKCEKLTDDGRQVMAKAHIAFGKVSLKSRECSGDTKNSLLKLSLWPNVSKFNTTHILLCDSQRLKGIIILSKNSKHVSMFMLYLFRTKSRN